MEKFVKGVQLLADAERADLVGDAVLFLGRFPVCLVDKNVVHVSSPLEAGACRMGGDFPGRRLLVIWNWRVCLVPPWMYAGCYTAANRAAKKLTKARTPALVLNAEMRMDRRRLA